MAQIDQVVHKNTKKIRMLFDYFTFIFAKKREREAPSLRRSITDW
jgi:hypothetical protein